jgi:fructose-bisphosphate aldolase class II/tagatose 1,6-diphosphate aldolase GatY/KbaY
MVREAAEEASVPMALHLDHGDGFDRCMQALRVGYTSVIIDGSRLSFEENVAPMGVPVEVQLGRVGGKEDSGPMVGGDSPYTDPNSGEAAESLPRR